MTNAGRLRYKLPEHSEAGPNAAAKHEEKRPARELRCQGFSDNEILDHVSVSKGTLSFWLRDITLTAEQITRFLDKRRGGRERFIQVMRQRRDSRWTEHQREAEEEYSALSQASGFMFGLALYIGEGSKTSGNRLCIANCGPRVIQKGLTFFKRIGVPEDVFGTGLRSSQFHVTRIAVSSAGRGTKGHLQVYGTCQIDAHSTAICQKVHKWMGLAL